MPPDKTTWASTHVTDRGVTFWENARRSLHTSDIFTTVVTRDQADKIRIPKDKYLCEPVITQRPCLSAHNRKLSRRLQELTGKSGLYVCGSAYGVDLMEADYRTGVAIANIHSDKVSKYIGSHLVLFHGTCVT